MSKTDSQNWLISQLEMTSDSRGDEPSPERRRKLAPGPRMVRTELNEAQLAALADLERYGLELKFVRHSESGQIVPYVFDSDLKRYMVLRPDGTIDEKPKLDTRKL
jgi:hypothetical protein